MNTLDVLRDLVELLNPNARVVECASDPHGWMADGHAEIWEGARYLGTITMGPDGGLRWRTR